jgi:hypothetical protein
MMRKSKWVGMGLVLGLAVSLWSFAGAQTVQFLTTTIAQTISAVHTFDPTSIGAPFTIGANATNQTVTGLKSASAADAELLGGNNAAYYRSSTNQNAGTLADARLSTNIPRLASTNTYTQGVTITNGTATNRALTISAHASQAVNTVRVQSSMGVPYFVVNETGRVGIGTDDVSGGKLQVIASGVGESVTIFQKRYSDDTGNPIFRQQKARGTEASPLNVPTVETIGLLTGDGYINGSFQRGSEIRTTTQTVGATSLGAKLELRTSTSAGTITTGLVIDENQRVTIGTAPGGVSAFQVPNGQYAQFSQSGSGVPTAADCDDASELGRIYIRTGTPSLYVCLGAAGWLSAALS